MILRAALVLRVLASFGASQAELLTQRLGEQAAQVGVRAGICMMAVPTRMRVVRARSQAAVDTASVP